MAGVRAGQSNIVNGDYAAPSPPGIDFKSGGPLHNSYGKDQSTTRGRNPGLVAATAAGLALPSQSISNRALSPKIGGGGTEEIGSRPGTASGRRKSRDYGHNRQTSIIEGIHHSRNNSQNDSPPYSGGSPPVSASVQGIAQAGFSYDVYDYRTAIPSQHASTSTTLANYGTPSTQASNPFSHNTSYLNLNGDYPASQEEDSAGRRDHGRNDSKPPVETRPVVEYALHHLFNSFVGRAELKMDKCVADVPKTIARVEDICGPGADKDFDVLVAAMGHIARQKPRMLVDTIMFWRRSKSGDYQDCQSKLNKARDAASSGALQRQLNQGHNRDNSTEQSEDINVLVDKVVQAECKLSLAIYLICRVLVEVYQQSDLKSIGENLDKKLQDLIFDQLSRLDAEKVYGSAFYHANWNIYGQLIHEMSGKSFAGSSRHILDKIQKASEDLVKVMPSKDAVTRSAAANEAAARLELLVRALSYMSLSTRDSQWRETCDFMLALAVLFTNCHGQRVKDAYCHTLEILLLPIAASTPYQVLAAPRWREFLTAMTSRLNHMLSKPRYLNEVLPLSNLLLCVSPQDSFNHQWHQAVAGLHSKTRDKATRGITLQSITRLVWTYLDRSPDSTSVKKRLEDIIRVVVPNSKKQPVSPDPASIDAIVELARIIAYRYPDFCFDKIMFPLMNHELFTSNREIKVEQLEPDRIVIGIRAVLAVLDDLEHRDRGPPPFPAFDLKTRQSDPLSGEAVTFLRKIGTGGLGEIKEDPFLRPVNANKLEPSIANNFATFRDILAKVTILCNIAYGGQTPLEEKTTGSQAPKTPIAESFSFTRRDDLLAPEVKQAYYDLLHVAIQALPKCYTSSAPFKPIIGLLCTASAHPQIHIATSAAASLKAIARQHHAQSVTVGFGRYLFDFDSRYWGTVSDDGLLGPNHIQTTLQLYVDLLKIWIVEIKQKKTLISVDSPADGNSGNRGLQLELANISALVEEVESYGFFFLCSQSRSARTYAITVLKLIVDFDAALGRQAPRIIHILEGDIYQVISPEDDRLTVAERSKLEKGKRKGGTKIGLVDLCNSEAVYDTLLWFKIFPNVVKLCFIQCQITVTMGRNHVCSRLYQMHKIINTIAESARSSQPAMFDRMLGKEATPQNNIIEQWKLYLVTACTTLTNTGAQTQSQLQHARSRSKPGSSGAGEQIMSARSLFPFVIPLLNADVQHISDAIVIALGSINTAFYRTLLESLQYAVTTCNEAARVRGPAHQRSGSASRQSTDRLRTEVTHVYKLTSKFLQEEEIRNDDWIVRNLVAYTNLMKRFLSDAEVQNDPEHNTLRRYYCGLVEEVYEALRKLPDPTTYMSFDDRKATFTLMEEWSGYLSISGQPINQDTIRDPSQTAATEIAKLKLRNAALGAMSSLCAGPISTQVGSEGRQPPTASFDLNRIMDWIYQILEGPGGDLQYRLGQRALKNLIVHNTTWPNLLAHVINMCFEVKKLQALQSYFEVVSTVLSENEDYPCPFWRVIVLSLFNLGNEDVQIRTRSLKLLRTLEERQQRNSKLQDFDISVADKTTAVYKLAQFEISRRLAKYYSDDAFFVFSQFAAHFKNTHGDNQRNMIISILPWIQLVELKVDPNGSPTPQTYMFLANLLEITTKSPTSLHNEVQATWQALAAGPHGGNVQVVLDFVIALCIDRREQSFVAYAKQIVVYLSSTQAGQKVVDFLLLQITPKNMVHSEKKPMDIAPDVLGLPYVADIGEALPIGNKQAGFSLGQLALILLVDLIVPSVKLSKEHVPLLLQVCLVLWDHYTILVQDQAREMLVHLIHELVLSKIEDSDTAIMNRKKIEDFVDDIRQSKPSISWTYQESNSKDDGGSEPRVPAAMDHVINQVIDLFSITYPNIHQSWAKTTLNWATSCSVRHLACRSFQLFRCMLSELDSPMLADMLARLSNTIADESVDVQSFSMEILATLKTIIKVNEAADLLKYPQLFWVTCACLDTVNEREFIETLNLLGALLTKVDLSDPAVERILMEARPPRWEGEFEGIMPLVYKGLKSDNSLTKTLEIINKTAMLPSSVLIGDGSRLLFGVLANLPTYLRKFEVGLSEKPDFSSADTHATIAEQEGRHKLASILSGFHNGGYSSKEEFLFQILNAIRREFSQDYEVKTLIFLIGLVTNRLSWFLLNTIDILQVLVSQTDMRKPEVASLGPDVISPLLRLLQGQYCPQALGVLDHITYLYSSTNDRQSIRMSMVAAGSRSLRKDYDKTQSLYGIPEETGWSIPMPALHSASTRTNVHAVFYTCLTNKELSHADAVATPEIEFDLDDFQQGSFFSIGRGETFLSEDYSETSQSATSGSDIVARLDSLDDIFDDDPNSEDKYLSTYSDVTITGYNVDSERTASIYDLQTAPILERATMGDDHQGRTRTPSVSSLHNPYNDDRQQRAQTLTRKPSSDAFPRPSLHSRSVTSPSNPSPNTIISMDPLPEPEIPEELFSDDERSTSRDAPPGFENFVRRTRSTTKKPMADGKEYHQRDLLRGQGRLRSKSQAPDSPEVPKVPEAYLNNLRRN